MCTNLSAQFFVIKSVPIHSFAVTEVRSEAVTGLAQQTCSDLGGTFRSGHGLSSADAFRPWCSQVPGGGVVDFLRKLFLFISHTILSKAKVVESNLHLEYILGPWSSGYDATLSRWR